MGAKAKVSSSDLMLFVVVFGLRIFSVNCQRYQQQQQIQMHIPLQQQMQAGIPIQKDLLSNENRLQSQVQLCSRGRLVFPCPKRVRKPFFFMLPVSIPLRSTVQPTPSIPQVPLRTTASFGTSASLMVQDSTGSGGGQKEYYTNWSHTDNTQTEQQEVVQPQRRPGKNCKRKRRPQALISTTASPQVIPQRQYWRGQVEDEQPRLQQRHPSIETIPTQISERVREPSTTKFAERIGEAVPSRPTDLVSQASPTQVSNRNRDSFSSVYPEAIRSPQPTVYSEKIREYNPTKDTLIARLPITSTVFDKIRDPLPTKISERNRDSFSTRPSEIIRDAFSTRSSEKVPQDVTPTKNHEPMVKKYSDRGRDALSIRNSEKIREPLAALEKEQKQFQIRDRQRQEFVTEVTTGYRDKSYRRPYSQAKKESTQQTPQAYPSREEPGRKSPSARLPVDLKEILKNSGGLSLSEILQQKNLSLDDLLKGKQNALMALQTTATAPQKSDESNSRERTAKPSRRLPSLSSTPAITSTTTVTPTITEQSIEDGSAQSGESQELLSEELASNETIEEEVAKKNVTSIRKNLKFPSRIRMSTTTRRTTQPPETTQQQKFSTSSSTTTTKPASTTRIPLYKKRQHTRPSPMRSPGFKRPDLSSISSESKESRESSSSLEDAPSQNYSKRSRYRSTTTTTTESPADQTDPASNFVEDSGENEVLLSVSMENTSSSAENNSMIASKDQQSIESKDESTTDHIYRYNSLKNYIDNNLPHAVFMDIDLADIDPVDDRTDLLELIEDRRSGNRLIKVLEQRNMTLEELIEHRKRGASQLHLATFVQNKSGVFPGKKVIVNDDMDIVTAFENFPHFNLLNLKSVKPDEIKTDSQGSSYFTSIIDIEPTDESSKEANGSIRKNSIRNPSSQRQPFYPSWKSLALASLATTENARRFLQRNDPEPPKQTAQRHQSAVIEENPILQIEDEVARAHDLVDLELSGHGFKRSATNLMHTSQMPAGIRSAIVASAAIVLTSLVTFMVIFAACRWKQRRRRRKMDYMETYNALKSKIPVISSRRTDELTTSTTSLGLECSPSRTSRSGSRHSQHHRISIVFPGGGRHSSVTSLSSPNSRLNTMDPSSPEVQEYLFDALRNSF